jgi:two-component system sensor kinase
MSVSHGLRAPLRAIDGFSRVILEDYTDKFDDEGKRVLNIIRGNTQKMGQLIDDILVLSRLGRKEITHSDIDMGKLAKTIFGELKLTVPERKIEFTHINTLSPAQGDQAMIRQVFVNLLSNAVKFTQPKETAIIELGGFSEENENVYYVKDNGVGFDMQYVNKLFGVLNDYTVLQNLKARALVLPLSNVLFTAMVEGFGLKEKWMRGPLFISLCQEGRWMKDER